MSEQVSFDPSGQPNTVDINGLADWEKHNTSTTDNIQIQSGAIVFPAAASNNEATSQLTAAHNENQYCEIEIGGTRAGSDIGVLTAAQAPSTSQNFYMGLLSFDAGSETSAQLRTAEKVAGVYASDLGAIAVTVYADSVLRQVRVGSTAYSFVDGEQRASHTDNQGTPFSGGQPGIVFEEGNNITSTFVRSGNVLSATNTMSETGTNMADQSDPKDTAITPLPMNDDLGNPKFSSTGIITKYRGAGMPPGIVVNESTGEMTGTPTTAGIYEVHVWAEDDQGWLEGSNFTWEITDPAADTTPPVFTAGPTASNPTTSGHTFDFTLDEAGTVFFVKVASGAAAPSVSQVKAGQDSTGSPALENGSKLVSAGVSSSLATIGGAASTTYDHYFVAQDDESTPNVQASTTLVTATTAATASPSISISPTSFTYGSTVTITTSNFTAAPTQVTLTDTNNNQIVRTLTDIGSNQYTFTIPALPTAEGSTGILLQGTIVVEATEGV